VFPALGGGISLVVLCLGDCIPNPGGYPNPHAKDYR
jgi:hypothetical protein